MLTDNERNDFAVIFWGAIVPGLIVIAIAVLGAILTARPV